MKEFLKYFLLKFWPNILDDIWHDCKAVARAFRDTREVYKRQSLAMRKLSKPYQLDLHPNSQPLWNSGIEQRRKLIRFGHDPIKVVFNKRYPDGTNIYRASLLNLRELNDTFSRSSYRLTPVFVVFVWALRNVVFKRHFKGWFRSYLFKNAQRLKEYTYAYIYSFGSWWPISALRWLFIRIIFRVLINLLFLGPVLKVFSGLHVYLPSFPKVPTIFFRPRVLLLFKTLRCFLKRSLSGFFWLVPTIFFRPIDGFFRILIGFDLVGVILFSIFRRGVVGVFSVVALPLGIFFTFLLNHTFRFLRLTFSSRSTLLVIFFHKRVLALLHYFAYIPYFKCMLARHLSSVRIRIRLRRKKPNPIRRFSNWVTYTRYKFTRYQVEKLFYAIGQFFLVLPVRFSKTRVYKFFSHHYFQVFFWRGFPFEKPYPSHFLTDQTAAKFFSYLSIYDDLTLTNFFSNETAFPSFRLIFYEYDDWSANFEEFDELETHILDMSTNIRIRRRFVVNFVSHVLSGLKAIPSSIFRFLFSGAFLWYVTFVPYILFDCLLGALSLLVSAVKFVFYIPIYFGFYAFSRIKTAKLVLTINIQRSDRYGLYSGLYFILTAFISLFLFLEFFYIFGFRILLLQEFLMRNLDSYMYNYLFIWLLPVFILSLVSQPFTEIWREAKYYMLIYPIVVHGWLLFYLIHWTSKKKFGMVGNFADFLNKGSFWFNDALHPILGYFYLNWQPFLKYKRFTSSRPYHSAEFDLKQATFDFVTSLF